jgi:cobalt-zinc-cadmium efflux system outer membrane protein
MMLRKISRSWVVLALLGAAAGVVGQTTPQTASLAGPQAKQPTTLALTWEQVKDRLELGNPTLLADKISIDESRAQEITAFLRPNPTFTMTVDGTQISPDKGVWRPFAGTFESPAISYEHERRHKRELRLESQKKATKIAISTHADLQRTTLFNLRSAFVSALQAKAVLQLAKDNLEYYDHILQISRGYRPDRSGPAGAAAQPV